MQTQCMVVVYGDDLYFMSERKPAVLSWFIYFSFCCYFCFIASLDILLSFTFCQVERKKRTQKMVLAQH